MTEPEVSDDDFCIERLLERAEFIRCAATQERKKEEYELADMVEKLHERMEAMVNRHAEGNAHDDRCITLDTQRSENAKQRHEELSEEFREFCNWHLVEPRSLLWRTLDKVGFYITVIVSFIFVVPFTACYSKTLRFIRMRRRRFSTSRERPAWTTGHGEVEPDFVSSDFFGEGGLARLAVNPLGLSSSSLGSQTEQLIDKGDEMPPQSPVVGKIAKTGTESVKQKPNGSGRTSPDLISVPTSPTAPGDEVLNGYGSTNGRRLKRSVSSREDRAKSERRSNTGAIGEGTVTHRRTQSATTHGESNPKKSEEKKKEENTTGWILREENSESWKESSNSSDFWVKFE